MTYDEDHARTIVEAAIVGLPEARVVAMNAVLLSGNAYCFNTDEPSNPEVTRIINSQFSVVDLGWKDAIQSINSALVRAFVGKPLHLKREDILLRRKWAKEAAESAVESLNKKLEACGIRMELEVADLAFNEDLADEAAAEGYAFATIRFDTFLIIVFPQDCFFTFAPPTQTPHQSRMSAASSVLETVRQRSSEIK